MKRAIRMGVVGPGGAGTNRTVQLARHELGVDIVAAADIVPAQIDQMEQKIGNKVQRFIGDQGYREMIDTVELDAVGVFTPHTTHHDHAVYALESGKHLLVEKPMVCGAANALTVAKLAQDRGLVCLIHYQRHYEPQYIKARDMIRRGDIGEVQTFFVYMAQDWSGRNWRGDPAFSGGGQINDSGSHYQDILLWMTDLVPASAQGQVDRFYHGEEKRVPINGSFDVKLSNGAGGRIIILGDTIGGFSDDVRIRGEAGDLVFYGSRLFLRPHGKEPREIPLSRPKGYPISPCDNFVKLLRKRARVNRVPPVFGARVALLTDAMLRSAETGARVDCAELLAAGGHSLDDLA